MIDALADGYFGGVLDGAEQRKSAVAEAIARLVIDEADDLIAELAVFEDLVGHESPELAGPGDQNPLEADAGAPPPLQHFSHELAGRERQQDVQEEKDHPHDVRDLEFATH